MPTAGSPRPVWLDDKTKSIMDRAIAREQSLSRLLMAYIVTGLVFMLLPGTFRRLESHQDQRPRSGGINFSGVDTSAWPRAAVRLGGHVHRRHWFLFNTETAEAEAFCPLVRMAYVGALGDWRNRPLVLEYLSMALEDCPALVRYTRIDRFPHFLSSGREPSPLGRFGKAA